MRDDKKVTIILVNREILNYAKKIKQSGQSVGATFDSILVDGLKQIEKMSKQDVWRINDEINEKYLNSNLAVNADDEIDSKTLSRWRIKSENKTNVILQKEAKCKKITSEKLAFIALLQIKYKDYDKYITSNTGCKKLLDPHKDEIIELTKQNPNASIYQLWQQINLPVTYVNFRNFIKGL